MGRVKRLNSKTNVKQKTNADLPFNPRILTTLAPYVDTTTTSQTVITLPFAVEQVALAKRNFFLYIDGSLLLEGASNDYQFTSIAANNTSSEITLNDPVPAAGLNIFAINLGIAIQNEPSNPNLQAQINNNLALYEEIAYLKDVKASGTSGGGFTSGSYQTRDLNTLESNGVPAWISGPTTNQFTLESGTYEIEASAFARNVAFHKIKLRNITDASDSIIGSSAYAPGAADDQTISSLTGVITIGAAKTFELQHRCSVTNGTDGFGLATTFGDDEVYAQVKIRKLS